MSLAAQSLGQCRRLLAMPPRPAALWSRLEYKHRRALLMMADLPLIWAYRGWESFSDREQQQILDQVAHTGAWQKQIEVPK